MDNKKILNHFAEYHTELKEEVKKFLSIYKKMDMSKLLFAGAMTMGCDNNNVYYYFSYDDENIKITYHYEKISETKSILVTQNEEVIMFLSDFDMEHIELYMEIEEKLKNIIRDVIKKLKIGVE